VKVIVRGKVSCRGVGVVEGEGVGISEGICKGIANVSDTRYGQELLQEWVQRVKE
jgi:hypothetical protein